MFSNIFQSLSLILSLMLTALFLFIYFFHLEYINYCSCQRTVFNVFERLFLIEYCVVPMKKCFQNSKLGMKGRGYIYNETHMENTAGSFKGLSGCWIGQKYSVMLYDIGAENMVLRLDGCFCFKLKNFIIFWKIHWFYFDNNIQ